MEESGFESLERAGWERRKDAKTGKYFYLTPSVNGKRRKVTRRRDLNSNEKQYSDVLFPSKRRKGDVESSTPKVNYKKY